MTQINVIISKTKLEDSIGNQKKCYMFIFCTISQCNLGIYMEKLLRTVII